jgi:hypothetical protein
MRAANSIASAFVLLGLSASGCGSAGGGLVPVEGIVTLDGKPLADIQVMFDQPELGPKENIGYTGRTNTEGRFTLRPTGKDETGAPPGKYRVSLTTYVDPTAVAKPQSGVQQTTIFYPEAPPPPPERVPRAYRQQSFEVPADGTDQANFDMKSR